MALTSPLLNMVSIFQMHVLLSDTLSQVSNVSGLTMLSLRSFTPSLDGINWPFTLRHSLLFPLAQKHNSEL